MSLAVGGRVSGPGHCDRSSDSGRTLAAGLLRRMAARLWDTGHGSAADGKPSHG